MALKKGQPVTLVCDVVSVDDRGAVVLEVGVGDRRGRRATFTLPETTIEAAAPTQPSEPRPVAEVKAEA